MYSDDSLYYRERAAQCRKSAETAESPAAARAHLDLAVKYEKLLELSERTPGQDNARRS